MNDRILSFMRYHPVRTQRGLEVVSGFMPWAVIFFVVVGSFFVPQIVASFILAFNVYWLYRSLQLAILATSGYLNLKAAEQVDWLQKLKKDSVTKNKYRTVYHLILIPNYKEPLKLLERNLMALKKQGFPKKKIFIVLAMEKREGEAAKEKANSIYNQFKNDFGGIITTYHELVPGETAGKHSNNTFAARTAKKLLTEKRGIPLASIIATQCDVDTVFPPQYLSALTYKFLTAKSPYNTIYQSPIFMYNNIHRLPLLVRIPAISSGIQYLALYQKPSGRFVNISVYSLALAMLDKVGYWDVDVIPEDWHLNLKAFFALKGNLTITPLYLPIYIDAAESFSRWGTFVNSYLQARRWAWGIVDLPYVIKKFFLHPEISIKDRLLKISAVFETHFVWSSWWFLLVLGATIPTIINPAFARTALGYNLSKVSSAVLTVGLIGVIVLIIMDALLNPNYKNRLRHFFHPATYIQWLLSPIAGLFFSFLPGLESQTRLMLGKRLEYRVTEKV